MKLAYLSNSKVPSREANSIHVMKMCQAFASLGHEVVLLAPNVQSGLESGISDPFAFYGVKPCFEVRKLPWRAFKGRGWIYGWESARFAHRSAFDAAFGRCLHSCAVAARLGIPTVWDAHMLTFLQRRDERLLFRLMITAPAFRGMTVNCDALRRCIAQQVPEVEGRIRVAHNGADAMPDNLTPMDLGGKKNTLRVGYIGHLYPGKGLEIIRELAARAPWAEFHVVGGQQQTIDELRNDTTFRGNLRLHGFVAPSEAERLTLAFDVLLAPYQREVQIAGGGETASWMSPLKLFTYMAAGKPILCSDLPVLREIIQHGRNGLLVAPDDPDAWLAALKQLLVNPTERAQLGINARSDFLAKHTWQQRARRVLEFLAIPRSHNARELT
jgi:glycosyltransferase involved in cell wall biosynthesis